MTLPLSPLRERLAALGRRLRRRLPAGLAAGLPAAPAGLPAALVSLPTALAGRLRGFRRRLPALPGGLRPWITLASLGFVLAALVANGRALLRQNLDPQGFLWLLLGVGLSLLSVVVNGVAWTVLLRWLGLRPRAETSVAHFMTTNLRKFLPGGIWHLAARVQGLRQGTGGVAEPLPTAWALVPVLLEPLLAATAALALVSLGGWQGGLALLGPAALLVLHPRWLVPLLRRLERGKARALQLDLPAAEAPLPASLAGYPWPPLLLASLFVLLRFAGFACCVWAFDLPLALEWSQWLAAFALAWTVGLVVPGAPGGLGVFEAVLLLRLGGSLAPAPLLAVALSYRLVVTLADVLAALLAELDGRLAALAPGLSGVTGVPGSPDGPVPAGSLPPAPSAGTSSQ